MTNFKTFIGDLTDFIANTIGGLFITLAVSAFLFAVVNFIWKRAKGADGNGFKDARNQLGWSIVALFVLFSIWGIIAFLQSGIFGSGGAKTQIDAPSVRVNTSPSGAVAPGAGTSAGSPSTAGAGRAKLGNGMTCRVDTECESGFCNALNKCSVNVGSGRGGIVNPPIVNQNPTNPGSVSTPEPGSQCQTFIDPNGVPYNNC